MFRGNVVISRLSVLLLLLSLAASVTAGETPEQQKPNVVAGDNDTDKTTFLMALKLGKDCLNVGQDVDFAELRKAAQEALDEKPSKFSEVDAKEVMKRFMAYLQKKNQLNAKFKEDAPLLATEDKKNLSYIFGRNLGLSDEFGQIAPFLNLDLFFDVYAKVAQGGQYPSVNLNDLNNSARRYSEEIKPKVYARMCERNKKAGTAFLAENKNKPGVVTTASGLQYKILREGTGPKPEPTARVIAHFRASSIDGKILDDTHARGPAHFAMDGVIDGWIEALKMMPEGSLWELYVPSDLAYGDAGRRGVPPGMTLVYQLELISAKAKEEPKDEKDPQPPKPDAPKKDAPK